MRPPLSLSLSLFLFSFGVKKKKCSLLQFTTKLGEGSKGQEPEDLHLKDAASKASVPREH